MDKKLSEKRKRKLAQKRLDTVFIAIVFSIVGYWLAYLIFFAHDCEFFGSKTAWIIVPACEAFGNKVAAFIPFIFASIALYVAILSYVRYRSLARHPSKAR